MRLPRTFPHPAPPAHRLDPYEAKVITAWGHTEQSWAALTAQERASLRTHYTKAPRYAA